MKLFNNLIIITSTNLFLNNFNQNLIDMKNNWLSIFAVFILSLSLVSCKGNKQNSDSSKCEVTAKVIDFTGLSSCSILLELKDGSYLNPALGAPRQELLRAEKVKISYKTMESAMSSCMKGQLVEITCFKVIKKGTPIKAKID